MKQCVVAVTGGGSGAFERLLAYGGASSWFIEGIIPYAKEALTDYLGKEPERYCSDLTARRMAMVAFKRCVKLQSPKDPRNAMGIGCTASLALAKDQIERTGRPHKFSIAYQTDHNTGCFSFCLPGLQNRWDEEQVVSDKIYKIIKGFDCKPFDGLEQASDYYDVKHLLLGKSGFRTVDNIDPRKHPVIYSGSFNPIHKGHIDVIEWANKYLKVNPFLEIAITNPDKGSIDYIDIKQRVDSITEKDLHISDIILSSTPRFIDKSYKYLCPKFIVGVDTYNRIFDVSYYKNQVKLEDFIDYCKATQVHFYVLDRKGHTANSFLNRYSLEKIVTFVPKNEYEDVDGISSSQLRKGF